MRILHTSDWHLGLSTGNVSRVEDQRLFLDWLTARLREDAVDALVVAGDIFDGAQPSSEAQAAYYRFLATLPSTGVRDVVIVGGNHDSRSRLDAPREVLAALDIHVVGGLPAQGEDLAPLVVPLRARDPEDRGAVCLAVPFVHEYRLGVRTTDLDSRAVAEAFRERFSELYTQLADRAEARYPGLPIVATGHLVLGGYDPGDFRDDIHQIGFIGALPSSVLDPRIVYGALGHIHQSRPVASGRAWYSGSPIPVGVTEIARPRRVLQVDLAKDGEVTVSPIDVPVFRELRVIEGSPEELETALREGTSPPPLPPPLPPLVFVRARLEAPHPQLRERLEEAMDTLPPERRPMLVDVRELFLGGTETETDEEVGSLEALSVSDVFNLLCRSAGVTDASRLERAFATLTSLSEEELAAAEQRVARGEDLSLGGAMGQADEPDVSRREEGGA